MIEAERHEREAFTIPFAHDDETQLGQTGGKAVRRAGQVAHYHPVAMFSEADQLIILANDVGGAFREVEGQRGLIGPQIVDVEDEFFG